jgi:site-specific DNA recombinase
MTTDASSAQSAAPVRAVAYVRVSQARNGMISPELQMRAIEDYCRRRRYLIIETLQDLDLSGRIWRHRQMDRAIAMIEHGDAQAIVVWRWSGVTRNRLDWALAVDRVEGAGGLLESATEGFDTTTSTA